MEFYIEIGSKRKRNKCTTDIWSPELNKRVQPKVEITDRYITIHNFVGSKISMSIYDLLERCDIETGISSEVQYVGYTENPEERPFNREHRGFADMLHWTTREDEAYDYFVFYNLFKGTAIAARPETTLNFVVANSMTDEVPVSDEEHILEKVLIKYFGTKPQELNKKKKRPNSATSSPYWQRNFALTRLLSISS